MDFTSATTADPQGTVGLYALSLGALGSGFLMMPFSEMEGCSNGYIPLHCKDILTPVLYKCYRSPDSIQPFRLHWKKSERCIAQKHSMRISYDIWIFFSLTSFITIFCKWNTFSIASPWHFFLMLFLNNTLGPVEPRLCVEAHCGGDDGGQEGRGGWFCSVCLPSCLAAHSSLIAQVPHTYPLTYCSAVVCAVRLMHTKVFYTQCMAVITE